MATNQLEHAVDKSIAAAVGFFAASKDDQNSKTRGLQHLSDGVFSDLALASYLYAFCSFST